MNGSPGFGLPPLAAQDITDIWEYIAKDNSLAARRVREELLNAIRSVLPFPHSGYRRPNLTSRPLRFKLVREYVIAPTRRTKSRSGLSPCSTAGAILW